MNNTLQISGVVWTSGAPQFPIFISIYGNGWSSKTGRSLSSKGWCPLFRPEEADVQTTLSVKDALAVTSWFAGSEALVTIWPNVRLGFQQIKSARFFLHVQQCGKENEANYLPPRLILRLTIGIIESWRVIPFGLQMFPGSVVLLRGTWRAKKYPTVVAIDCV